MTEFTFRSDIKVDLIQAMGNDEMVARSARVSTGNDLIEPKKIDGLINYLVRERHNSTLEHCIATFRVEAPFFVRDQWVRHRTQSYNIESARYKEFEPVFYVPSRERPLVNKGNGAHPNLVTGDDDQYGIVLSSQKKAAETAYWLYQRQLAVGVAEEVARAVLPVSTYTSFYVTANLQNWFKFLYLRDGLTGHPQYEIVSGANQVKAYLRELFPVTVKAWETHRKG